MDRICTALKEENDLQLLLIISRVSVKGDIPPKHAFFEVNIKMASKRNKMLRQRYILQSYLESSRDFLQLRHFTRIMFINCDTLTLSRFTIATLQPFNVLLL
jgi:hypothetical protein